MHGWIWRCTGLQAQDVLWHDGQRGRVCISRGPTHKPVVALQHVVQHSPWLHLSHVPCISAVVKPLLSVAVPQCFHQSGGLCGASPARGDIAVLAMQQGAAPGEAQGCCGMLALHVYGGRSECIAQIGRRATVRLHVWAGMQVAFNSTAFTLFPTSGSRRRLSVASSGQLAFVCGMHDMYGFVPAVNAQCM